MKGFGEKVGLPVLDELALGVEEEGDALADHGKGEAEDEEGDEDFDEGEAGGVGGEGVRGRRWRCRRHRLLLRVGRRVRS